jgi:hypothetical protein
MQRSTSKELLAAYNALPDNLKTTIQLAADTIGCPRKTLSDQLAAARKAGERKEEKQQLNSTGEAILQRRVKELERELAREKESRLSEEIVRGHIIRLAAFDPTPPDWIIKPASGVKSPGVPVTMLSDWHYGEVVDPLQVNGVNKFNLKIADARAQKLIERTIQLLNQYMTPANYPGIVACLGGDMVSGDIHEELSATNDAEIMPTVMHLVNTLIWCIKALAEAFGSVLVPCVTGNHGRNTKKIRAKGRNHTSFDWLIYAILAKHFEGDKRVRFLIAGGADLHFNVYGHRYLLTHGDQFYGGDGQVGHIGPVKRGRLKKLSRDSAVNMPWDTMIYGHFHTYTPGDKEIGNGSLVGLGEYSAFGNFGYEPPRQALWITHPKYGITYHIPVYAGTDDELKKNGVTSDWCSWRETKHAV